VPLPYTRLLRMMWFLDSLTTLIPAKQLLSKASFDTFQAITQLTVAVLKDVTLSQCLHRIGGIFHSRRY
jgi:hypothetical protein